MLALVSLAGAAPNRQQIEVGQETRTYLVSNPAGVAGPAPVVIALHGAMQTPQSFRAYFGLDAAAAANGFVAVYPQGEGKVWNDSRPAAMRLKAVLRPGDDAAFLVALVAKLVADGVADPARIYLTGISNGGFMVERMACEHADLFAAYSVIMATTPANAREECRPARPVPMLFIHGTADTVITYNGFWTPMGATLSAPDSAAFFARLNGCGDPVKRALPDVDPLDGTTVTERTWQGCRDGATVTLLSVEGGGHQSPARVETRPDLATPFLGLRNHDIDAGEEVWRFMSAYTLAPALPEQGMGAAPPAAAPRKPKRAAASPESGAERQRGISTQ
ncbi:extracellular catalytic domain type 1 short-chain-length polyhydroxyalkanoate depolymerase [Xanthobacter variabilis]|uniref:extracellular catalytic domain type 1 short-chain-length polyhydroxyalkanoate depolymerase n=1 Tax=Xanthobacter variabilis TaxID=3119932 RepID=UPI00374EDD66